MASNDNDHPLALCMPGDVSESTVSVVSGFHEGVGLTIDETMAYTIIERFNLTVGRREYDTMGEKSALFEFDGIELRLQYEFLQRWRLYRGERQKDRNWTGG